MGYELFFKLNPKKLNPFVKAQESKVKYEYERIDYEAWLNGLYVRLATASVLSKDVKYPNKPLFLSEKDQLEGQQENSKEQAFKAKFEAWSKTFNKQIKNNK